jgi:hypothetical protein
MKIFRDPVHDYIKIPDEICSTFIDTPIFQRLRHIQQTSMGVLFPAANHNRFSHSIGTFHLGKIAFTNFVDKIRDKIRDKEIIDKISELEYTFLISCLMHDCGHSPFSHIFESQYESKSGEPSRLTPIIIDSLKDERFKNDLQYCYSSAHEKVSVIVFNKFF